MGWLTPAPQEKVKAAQEERLRKFESTSFAVWPDVLAPLLPPANERSYKVTDIATLVRTLTEHL